MNFEINNRGDVAIIALSGDIDLETSPQVRTALLDCVSLKGTVIVDLAAVSYIDSSGVASLVEAFQNARKGETRFALAAVSEAAMRVLELARLDKVFSIHSTVADGLADGK